MSSASMLASSVAAPAATRFGKKAQGVSARKAISRVPVGGHKVQVRLLSSRISIHPPPAAVSPPRGSVARAARRGRAIARRFNVVVVVARRLGRIPARVTRLRPTPRPAARTSPPRIPRYLDTSADKFLGTAEDRPRRARASGPGSPPRAPFAHTQFLTYSPRPSPIIRPRPRLRSSCPPRAPRRRPS